MAMVSTTSSTVIFPLFVADLNTCDANTCPALLSAREGAVEGRAGGEAGKAIPAATGREATKGDGRRREATNKRTTKQNKDSVATELTHQKRTPKKRRENKL